MPWVYSPGGASLEIGSVLDTSRLYSKRACTLQLDSKILIRLLVEATYRELLLLTHCANPHGHVEWLGLPQQLSRPR